MKLCINCKHINSQLRFVNGGIYQQHYCGHPDFRSMVDGSAERLCSSVRSGECAFADYWEEAPPSPPPPHVVPHQVIPIETPPLPVKWYEFWRRA